MNPVVTLDARMIHSAGIGTYLQGLLPRLVRLRPDYQFRLLGRSTQLQAFDWTKAPNVQVINCIAPIYGVREQLEMSKKIPRDTDLFWSPHYNIPLFFKGKLLVTVHDVFHLAMPQYTGGLHKRLYAKFMFSSVRKKAAAILCVSRFTQGELLKYTGAEGTQPEVVYNGVDESWRKIAPGPNPRTRPYILYVGSVKPHKNLLGLIEAFEKVKDRIAQDLVIVGKKEGFITGDRKVMDRAESLGDRVHFTGEFQHGEEVFRQYYTHADFLVLPSLYESFGLPVLEAMACGCPTLVSNLAAFPEVYGEAACYCNSYQFDDIADKLLLLAWDPNLRNEFSKKGLEKAKTYTWDKSADGVLNVMERILKP